MCEQRAGTKEWQCICVRGKCDTCGEWAQLIDRQLGQGLIILDTKGAWRNGQSTGVNVYWLGQKLMHFGGFGFLCRSSGIPLLNLSLQLFWKYQLDDRLLQVSHSLE